MRESLSGSRRQKRGCMVKGNFLVGDIGGTKSTFAILQLPSETLQSQRKYLSKEFTSFEDLLDHVIAAETTPLDGCILGVAGLVRNQRCSMTNLPWIVDQKKVAKQLRVPVAKVRILNDFEAAGWGVLTLGKSDVQVLQRGLKDPSGTCALLGPGTGLGEAIILQYPSNNVIATEGGHCDLVPRTLEQCKLVQFLEKHQHLRSWETVLSGRGMTLLYEFYTNKRLEAEAITTLATQRDAKALATIQLFWQLLAQESAALALKARATGGLYIGGGIPPKILPFLNTQQFLSIFADNNAMRSLLITIPVSVVTAPDLALRGIAHVAESLLQRKI